MPDALNDRAQDGCEVLTAIADLAGGEWAERGRQGIRNGHGRKKRRATTAWCCSGISSRPSTPWGLDETGAGRWTA